MTARYSLLYVDPPWSYGNTISNGAAADHYSTMKLIDLKRLPVWELAAENAVLAMWYTGTHNQEAIELAEAWGFTVRTMKGFTWKTCRKKVQKGSVAGSVCGNGRKLYVKVRIGRLYRAHRLIWLIVTGEWPKYHIDHVDNDGTNNRWSNLRLATLNQNQHNRELSRANLTGYKGVSRANNLSKPYRANITIGRERRHLGYYRSAEEAAHAYDESARELFGEYARLNFPHENELAARKLLPGCAIDVVKTEAA